MQMAMKCLFFAAWIGMLALLARHCTHGQRWKLLVTALCGALLAIWLFIDALSVNGIDYAVIYHLRAGMRGAGAADFSLPIGLLSAALVACLALAFMPRLHSARRWAPAGPLFAASLLATLVFNPIVYDVATLVRQDRQARLAPAQGDQYVRPDAPLGNHRNVVILYAESFERTYLDESRFPGLAPELNKLRSEAVDFRHVDSREGGTWTIAGMVSSLCGVPLSLSQDANGYASIGRFLPGAYCLTDHLRERGYDVEFIGGAASDFAGKGQFLASHGFGTVRDRSYFKSLKLGDNRFSPWGVHDDVLLDALWDRFAALSQQTTPFALVGLTLDTHHPSGHIPHACLDVAYEGLGQRRPMLDAIHCSDRLVADFVRRIRASPYARNTIIVVASDHLALPNDIADLLRDADRSNLLLMFGSDLRARQVDRPATTLDTGASLLDALQGGVALGFGRSQLSVKGAGTSLSVRPGREPDASEDHLPGFMAYSSTLWELGRIDDHLQLVDGVIQLGKQTLTPPLAIAADDRGRIAQLGTNGIRSGHLLAGGDSQQVLYIDRCFAFDERQPADEWCLWGSADGTARVVSQQSLKAGALVPELLQAAREAPPASQLRNDFIIRTHFDASHTIVGEVMDGKLFSQGAEGTLAYGAYQDLCAGNYTLSLQGVAHPANGAWADVVASYGAQTYDRHALLDTADGRDGTMLEARYVFPEDLPLAEVRVGVSPDAAVRLDGYTLLPAYEALPVGSSVDFSADASNRFISCGWHGPSPQGRSVRGAAASLRLRLPSEPARLQAVLSLSAQSPRELTVLANDAPLGLLQIEAGTREYPVDLAGLSSAAGGQLTLTLVPGQTTCATEDCELITLHRLHLAPAATAQPAAPACPGMRCLHAPALVPESVAM
ncbi:sulfatase-like hydrolase/transferase [Stenotrophomonas sp. CASM110]|uniref:sulfatase-like hydrolase/transferase n=1 Tax=Stenotrophomonas sp. CASM110 TaxID=3111510 RepID=UPI003BF7E049